MYRERKSMSTREKKQKYRRRLEVAASKQYEFPIPSREAVLAALGARGTPLSLHDLSTELGIKNKAEEEAFTRRLRAMERDGQILRNRRGLYGLPRKMDMVRGRIVGHPDGFGFLEPDEGGDDLFIPPKEMRRVLHGDRALARVSGMDHRGRKEGAIVEVLEHGRETVVGRYVLVRRTGFLIPEDKRISQDILIPQGEENEARDGQIVVAQIMQPPGRHTAAVGRIVEILGEQLAPGMEIEIAVRTHEIPHHWPEDAIRNAQAYGKEVPEEAKCDRVDLRSLSLVTIDGEDARDFDDAVYCEPQGKSWRVVVAIADVAHYVIAESALDREAFRRGNSVYFPQKVFPMLPEALSNGLCSLNPQVDRLCVFCDMRIGSRGNIESYRFHEGIMSSRARLTYNKVAAMLVDQNPALRQEYAPVLTTLESLYAVYRVLRTARVKRGAFDLDLPESRIVFDDQRKIERIVAVVRNDAHRMIEECMLAANVCAADALKRHKLTALYRVHEPPPPEKLTDLREFLAELGLSLGGGKSPTAQHYSRLIGTAEKRPDSRLVQMVLLRSLSKARYSPDNVGHFALAFPHYAHFTSPIRRYPDLMVHRAIKSMVHKRTFETSREIAARQGEHCSMTERRADEATRDVMRWLKAEFMQDRIGEEFDGVISGVTEFGIFVELLEIYVDGLVHITALDNDYFHFDPRHHRLLGERTRKIYRLSDPVRVRVVRVDLGEAKIDFELAQREHPSNPRRDKGRSVRAKSRKPQQGHRRRGRS